jgi:membrane protease YdiL (CAAX protease family)
MKAKASKQLIALGLLLAIYAALAFTAYLLTPLEQFAPAGQSVPAAVRAMPRWQLAAANAGFIFVVYGLLGLAGYWFARKLDLPGIFRERAGWRAWVLWPALTGLVIGAVIVIVDQIFARAGSTTGLPHPEFPLSLISSAAAGIGEEILFRGFVMGLWAFLLNAAVRRWNWRVAALWIGNGVAALAFSAAHIPTAMILLKLSSPAQIPARTMAELLLLNSILGLVAGQRTLRDGLVAAIGVHFWADIVWHVLWPMMALSL